MPRLYHIADKADFRLDPKKRPSRNTTMGGEMKPGIFLSADPETWMNGYGYWRPFLVEFEVPAGVGNTGGGYGKEVYVLAEDYDKIRITRVIAIDAYARERFGDWGWTEEEFGTLHETGEPLPPKEPGQWFSRPPAGAYTAPDVRSRPKAWQDEYRKRVIKFRRKRGKGIMATRTAAKTLTLYHGTLARHVDAIRREGLKPPPGVNPAGWFMLTTSFDQAARYTNTRPEPSVVLEYRVPEDLIYAFENPNRGDAVLWGGEPHDVYGHAATAYAIKGVLPSRLLVAEHPLGTTARRTAGDYSGHHRAPTGADDVAAPFHDVEEMMPDYYAHPEYYAHDGRSSAISRESNAALMAARGKPDTMVTIYRALPPGYTSINPGDWVTQSLTYARQHAVSNGGPDWPVITAKVPAKTLWTEGYICEWGYSGPSISARTASRVATKGWHYAPRSAREDIEAHGLDWRRSPAASRPQDPRNQAPVANYFSPTREIAEEMALGGDYDLYEVDLGGTRITPDPYQPEDAFYTLDAIAPDRLRRQASATYSEHVMVALRPSEETCKAFATMDECTEAVEDLHLTLFYFGSIDDVGGEHGKERLYRALYSFAINSGYRGLTGVANGFGVFRNEQDSLIVLWDIPGIAEFRTHLMAKVKEHGVPVRIENHGFTPHMTLANSDEKVSTLPDRPEGLKNEEIFGSIWLVWGEEWTEVTLP